MLPLGSRSRDHRPEAVAMQRRGSGGAICGESVGVAGDERAYCSYAGSALILNMIFSCKVFKFQRK
jgi:hypothetical protein